MSQIKTSFLEVKVELNAIVPLSTTFSLLMDDESDKEENNQNPTEKNGHPKESASSSTSRSSSTSYYDYTLPHVRFIITRGNVFHPGSKIILNAQHLYASIKKIQQQQQQDQQGEKESIYPDDISSLTSFTTLSSNAFSKGHPQHSFFEYRIGEYNLFEECSTVTFQLYHPSEQENFEKDEESWKHDTNTFQLMGNYNHFAPYSNVITSRIGIGNVFEPFSSIHVPRVKNGNYFSPCSLFHTKKHCILQEMVFYQDDSHNENVTGDTHPIMMFRSHKYGTKKNITHVGILLNSCKKIIESNHPLMTPSFS